MTSPRVPASTVENARIERREPLEDYLELAGFRIAAVGDPIPAQPAADRVVPSGRRLLIQLEVARLNSPDDLRIVDARSTPGGFEFDLEHRDFEGDLAANVRSLALLVAETGPLEPGRYFLDVRTGVLGFRDPERPHRAVARPGRAETYDFVVAND